MHHSSPARSSPPAIIAPVVPVPDTDGAAPIGLERIVDALDQGLLIVDADARLRFANHSARGALRTGQPLVIEGGAVMPAVRAHRAGWRRTLSRLPPGGGVLFDLSGNAAPMHVTLNALRPVCGGAPGRSVIAIGMAPSAAAQGDRIDAYASHYRLTRAEARVLAQLLDDHAPGQIALGLGISVNTVRTHLKHILQKTGASSLRQLATMVLRMPVGFRGGR